MKPSTVMLASILSAFGATLCCLPALLFLLLGSSVATLSFLTSAESFRIPLTILSLGFLIFAGIRLFGKKSCTLGRKTPHRILYLGVVLCVSGLLFYPEVLNFYLETME